MDSLSIYFIVGLFVLLIIEIIFTYFILDKDYLEKQRLFDELAKANTALAAKSAQEYVMMRGMDNVVKEEPKREAEAKDISDLTDDEYDKMIEQQLK